MDGHPAVPVPPTRRAGRPRGFSLLEALVAFFLLFTTAVVCFGVIGQTRKGSSLSEAHLQAATVARDLLNQERALEFSEVAPATGSVTLQGVRNGQAWMQTMLYSVDVESLDADTRRVRATVRWQENGTTRKVVLQTVLTNI